MSKHPAGFVVLGKRKGGNAYSAVIERSFSMDVAPDRASFFWIGVARDNIVGATHHLTKEKVLKAAEKYRDMFTNSEMEFTVWDIDDPNLPITIKWDDYFDACAPSDKTLSGVKDKFRARNLLFEMK